MQAFPCHITRFLGLWNDCNPDIDGREFFGSECWTFGEESRTGASDTVLSSCVGRDGSGFSISARFLLYCGSGEGSLGVFDVAASIVI